MKGLLKGIAVIAGLFILMTVGMFVMDFCPPQGPWPMPPWCDAGGLTITRPAEQGSQRIADTATLFERPVFAANIDMMQIPMISQERLASIHANALGWQGLSVENFMYQMGSRQLIASAAQQGMPVLSSMNTNWLIRANPIDYPETAIVDINGNPVLLGDNVEVMHGTYRRNILHPDFQQMLLADAKANIDVGVRGIVFDDDGDAGSSATIYKFGGSFDDITMDGFRLFLQNKYSAEELRNRFAISDIESFHFREYIISNNLQDRWNADVMNPHPLTFEFSQFLSVEGRNIMQSVVQELKDYARSKHRREFLVSYNASPVFIEKAYASAYDTADILYGEHFWFHDLHFKGALAAKLAEGLTDRQFMILFEINQDRGRLPEPIDNAFKYAFADVYSSGNASLSIFYPSSLVMNRWEYVESIDYNDSVFEHYPGFMQQNLHLFSDNEPARVAVINSMASRRLPFTLAPRDLHYNGAPDRHLITITDMLLNNNIPFHMIISGKGMLGIKNRITAEQLSQYDLIVLPAVMAVTDQEAADIVSYARNGGTVLQINHFATLGINGQRVTRPDLSPFAQNPGTHQIGSGTWINENWGYRFEHDYLYGNGVHKLPTQQSATNYYLQRLNQLIRNHADPGLFVKGPLTVNVRRFEETDRILLHLVNYDFNHLSDTFTPSSKIEITLDSGDRQITEGVVYDIENRSRESVEVHQNGQTVRLTIPSVHVYTIVELQ